jgi:iron(III) transport system permease protein
MVTPLKTVDTAAEDPAIAPASAGGLAAVGRPERNGRRAPSALAWAVLVFLLGLVVGPVATVFYGAFQSQGPGMIGNTFSLRAVTRVYGSTKYLSSLFGSLTLALTVAALSVVVGGVAAWLLARTDVRGRGLLEFGVIVPLFMSPFVGAVAWSMLAAPRSGMINVNLQWMLHTSRVFVDITTFHGVVFVMLLYYVPYAYLLVSSALRNMDPSLEEASYMSGRGVVATALKVTLPIMRPSLAAAFFFVAVLATGVFAIPSVLELNAFTPLSVQVYRSTTVFPANPPAGAAIGTLLFWFTLAGIYFYRRAMRNGSRYVTVSARGTRPRVIRLGWKKVPVTVGFALYALLSTVLPYVALVLMALTPYAITDFRKMSLSFNNFLEVADTPDVLHSLANSLWLGFLVPTITVVLGMAVAYVVVRERGWLGGLIDYVSTIPIAVPGIVFASGIVWLYVRSTLYGSIALIVVALIGVYVPQASRFASAGLIQIDKSLEEAGRMQGAGKLRVIRTITFPLLRPSLLSAWILLFVFAMREVNETVIIAGPRSRPLSVLAYNFIEAGSIRNSAVVGLLLTVVMVAGVLIARIAFRVRLDSSNL